MKKIILTILICLFLLSGCMPTDEITTVDEENKLDMERLFRGFSIYIYRFTDVENGVICYVFGGSYKGGIDCIPLKDLE